MMAGRAERLLFVGERDAQGNPREYFAWCPARDLSAEEIAGLTDEQYRDITSAPAGRKPLYVAPKPEPVVKKDG